MAKIKLTEGFSLIPEGTHVFQITAVNYKETFGKMEITMQTQNGFKHIERFSLLKSNGDPNEGALNAFSYFAKVALNDHSRSEIDNDELLGCFMECDVEHDVQPNKNKPGQTVTFVRLANKRSSVGFESTQTSVPTANVKSAPVAAEAARKPPVDLKALLG